MVQTLEKKKTVEIGEYTLTGKIGQGGVAEIYRGSQKSLNRDVAIKILNTKLTNDPEIVRRFEQEAVVVARLNHPNIVHVIDKGKTGSRYYFVMDYIDGTNLRELIDSQKIGLNTKLEMIVQVCKALDYAHKNGIIHRDIKPANILIDKHGNALVADFGIAQIVGTPESEMTATDVIMGTLAYMSPEQKTSSTNVDQTTDIYAIGIILYEILAGKKPLGSFKPPSKVVSGQNDKFDRIVMKCLESEPKDRYQTAVELKDDLLNVMNNNISSAKTDEFSITGSESFMGKCRYLDTIKETRFSSTILVENKLNKQLYVIKKHSRGEIGRTEAKILKAFKHKNIAKIFGSGGDKRSTVIIAEYASGGSLADRMVRKYTWEKAFGIILDIATGLDFAHKNNVVHGNLRPSNILFDLEDTPKISDFGMPVHYDESKKKNWYMAPERKKSKQGDIYSIGVILYKMILGCNPFYDHQTKLKFGDFQNYLGEEVKRMLSKLLAIRVGNRYSSIEEFLFDWEEYDQIRQERNNRKEVVKEAPSPEKKSQIWKYVLVGVLAIILEMIVLYVTGMLK
ncbi:MAG: protein kinase [candidate division Zixibacteria bacterium]|nr:protein kinase [candidate division Zixibacteria bacterium]